MTAIQAMYSAEEDFIAAELDMIAAEQLLKEAENTAFRKGVDLLVACIRADNEVYLNGILKLCRTGR